MLTMRSGKTIGVWLLVVLCMAQGFLVCRAFQSFPSSSSGLSAQYQRAFLGQAKHDVISAQTQVRPIIRTGQPAAEIVQIAQEQDAGLLIIGARGQTRAEPFPLGGVAEKLVRFAPCSVLVAR